MRFSYGVYETFHTKILNKIFFLKKNSKKFVPEYLGNGLSLSHINPKARHIFEYFFFIVPERL
jgi:hypothetical protein